ncbi:MAG: DUF1826 domain-containing protein [Pseudohongiella sp.]|uniref:DUF1826 domain-containing protein n=1 Tax=Pseudohongiella sp. TaxID=1979412 RepID=UPI0034A00D35
MRRRTATAAGLSAIYSEGINLAEWQRELSTPVRSYAAGMVKLNTGFTLRQVVPADVTDTTLVPLLPDAGDKFSRSRLAFAEDLRLLCDMYACLFDLEQIGLRISVLNKAMCPRFHVDHVVCRLICTYFGRGTEWLPESSVNRKALGEERHQYDIETLHEGSVGLLKGEKWPGNEGRGLVHRSPAASGTQPRLVLTLDPVA